MEDLIVYLIIGVVCFWFFRDIYKKINAQDESNGCGGGCGGCSSKGGTCSENSALYDRKL